MRVAFLYPGQGAQIAGMGKDFYEQSEAAKKIYETANQKLGFDLAALCFEKNDLLDRTDYTQAAMFTTCAAMTKVILSELKEKGIEPTMSAGLSLGEYPAIYVAGGASFEDLLETVWLRGRLMHEAVADEGYGMSAVLGMTGETVNEAVKEIDGVTVANYNCPGQIVITGEKKGLVLAADALKNAGARRIMPLNVSGPFHSPYMRGAGEKLGEKLRSLSWKPLQIPYVANVDAHVVSEISETPALLEKQVSSSVLWEQSVKTMLDAGIDTFIEIGPGKTLAKFMARIDKNAKIYSINTVEDMKKICQELC